MEPSCRICTHLTPPAAFNSRTLESRYKSPVIRRTEYYEPRRRHAKVGGELKREINSCFFDGDRIMNQDSKRNVRRQSSLELSDSKINELKDAYKAITICFREMKKIKSFLEDDNSWWKILKGRSFNCCQQRVPHLHGILDGSSVTLLLEDGTDEVPYHFITSVSEERSNVIDSRRRTSSKEFKTKAKQTDHTNLEMEYTCEDADAYMIPHYSLDRKSALIEVTSVDSRVPSQRYVKKVTSEQDIVASEFYTEIQEDNEHKRSKRSYKCKETCDDVRCEDKEKRIDKPNITSSREIQHSQNIQTTFTNTLQSQQTFNNENIENKNLTTRDFESNVDLNTEIPSRNVSSHKPKPKAIIEKSVRCIPKFPPTKIAKPKNKNA